MLFRIFQRKNRIQTETRPRQNEAVLSCWETGRKKWSWGRHSESWERVRELVLPRVGLMIWILDITQWQNQRQEFHVIFQRARN